MILRHLLILLCVGAFPASAQTHSDRIVAAFEEWMQQQGVTVASIAIVDGQSSTATFTKGYGREADAPVTLASLSKAVTGACIAVLQQEGVFDIDAPVGPILDMPDVSGQLGDFLSHASGLWPDRTQNQPWHLGQDRAPRHLEAAEAGLTAPRGDTQFQYNNENYAVLGAVIDKVGQMGYEADCRQLVLDPLGITTAILDPVWGPLGAWGGWAMSAPDYARFVKEWFGTDRNIGRAPLDWPHADLGQTVAYVMGSFYRPYQDQKLFWHAGQLCWNGVGDSSYFASYGGDPVVVVSFEGCVDDQGFGALDEALFEAALR